MPLTITVTSDTDKATLIKAGKLMLELAGFEAPASVQVPMPTVEVRAGAGVAPLSMVEKHVWPEDHAPVVVPPAPPVAVPAPPVAPPAPNGIQTDKDGLPWDGRIHSSSHAFNADGTWRQRRNLPEGLREQVEAELRQTMQIFPSTNAGVSPPPVEAPPVVMPPFVGSAVPPVPPVPTIPTVSAGAALIASPSNAATFVNLMKRITVGFTTPGSGITQGSIDAACQKVGIPNLPMLAQRPDLVGSVATELGIAL